MFAGCGHHFITLEQEAFPRVSHLFWGKRLTLHDYGLLDLHYTPSPIVDNKSSLGLLQDVQDGLVAKGHRIATHIGSKVQAILKDGSRLYAVSDWRKGGAPDGY